MAATSLGPSQGGNPWTRFEDSYSLSCQSSRTDASPWGAPGERAPRAAGPAAVTGSASTQSSQRDAPRDRSPLPLPVCRAAAPLLPSGSGTGSGTGRRSGTGMAAPAPPPLRTSRRRGRVTSRRPRRPAGRKSRAPRGRRAPDAAAHARAPPRGFFFFIFCFFPGKPRSRQRVSRRGRRGRRQSRSRGRAGQSRAGVAAAAAVAAGQRPGRGCGLAGCSGGGADRGRCGPLSAVPAARPRAGLPLHPLTPPRAPLRAGAGRARRAPQVTAMKP